MRRKASETHAEVVGMSFGGVEWLNISRFESEGVGGMTEELLIKCDNRDLGRAC